MCFRTAAGSKAKWRKWRDGYRLSKDNPKLWEKSAAPSSSYRNFRKYLDKVFGIANSASILQQMTAVPDTKDIDFGDIYIFPANRNTYGHAVMVVDMAQNAKGEKIFLIAQSYMPAQEIHVLKNPENESY